MARLARLAAHSCGGSCRLGWEDPLPHCIPFRARQSSHRDRSRNCHARRTAEASIAKRRGLVLPRHVPLFRGESRGFVACDRLSWDSATRQAQSSRVGDRAGPLRTYDRTDDRPGSAPTLDMSARAACNFERSLRLVRGGRPRWGRLCDPRGSWHGRCHDGLAVAAGRGSCRSTRSKSGLSPNCLSSFAAYPPRPIWASRTRAAKR